MTDTPMGEMERWVRIYEDSGEMPPAGVLLKQAREQDARINALTRERDAAKYALAHAVHRTHGHKPDACDGCADVARLAAP